MPTANDPQPSAAPEPFAERSGTSDRLLAATTALLFALLLLVCVGVVAGMVHRDWSGARLAPTLAFVRGLTVYAPADEGPVLSSLYGPMSVLYYVPACLVPGVTARLLFAGALNVLALLVPLALLVRAAGRSSRTATATTLALAVAAVLAWPPTQQMIGGIHVDTPAVGLGFLACLALSGPVEPGPRRLGLAALLTVLAAWTKQVEAPLAFAELTYLGVRFGRRALWRHFVLLSIAAVVVSLLWLTLFPLKALLLNLIEIPATQRFAHVAYLPREMRRFLPPFLLALGVAWFLTRGARRRWCEAPGALLFLGFLFLLPTSLLARAKEGGFLNSLHALAFLLAAAAVAWTAAARTGRAARLLPGVAVLLGLALLPWRDLPTYARAPGRVTPNRHAQAAAFARAHPGEAYFPWNPLAHLEGEGVLYHFDYALHDRALSGFPVDDEHLREDLPPRMRWILVDQAVHMIDVLGRLPEFDTEIRLEEMPGWRVFVRGSVD